MYFRDFSSIHNTSGFIEVTCKLSVPTSLKANSSISCWNEKVAVVGLQERVGVGARCCQFSMQHFRDPHSSSPSESPSVSSGLWDTRMLSLPMGFISSIPPPN